MREVWDTDWLGSTKTLDTHVLALRNKLGPEAITTLRGSSIGSPELETSIPRVAAMVSRCRRSRSSSR